MGVCSSGAGQTPRYSDNSADVFPTTDAIWNIKIDGKEHYYGLSGDTVIDAISYNKLYLLNDTTLNLDSGDEYIGGFRQEGKKVWLLPYSDYYINYDYPQYPNPKETLLYDFSKNMGDTIWHNISPNIYGWIVGDSISASIITSIDTDEQGRKIYHTQGNSRLSDGSLVRMGRDDSWMEGIGSIEHGLFWFLCPKTVGGFPVFQLACFKQGSEVKYRNNPECNCCFSWYSPDNIPEINIFPVEAVYANDCIWIQSGSPVFPCELKLFSPAGQLIIAKTFWSDEECMPVNQTKGVLLYQIQKDKEIIKTGKIMIK